MRLGKREREKEKKRYRQTDRQTDRQKEKEKVREREKEVREDVCMCVCLSFVRKIYVCARVLCTRECREATADTSADLILEGLAITSRTPELGTRTFQPPDCVDSNCQNKNATVDKRCKGEVSFVSGKKSASPKGNTSQIRVQNNGAINYDMFVCSMCVCVCVCVCVCPK